MVSDDINKFTAEYNKTKVKDFDGFTPEEMYHIIHVPFADTCPIQFKKNIEPEILSKSGALNICLDLLKEIESKESIKLTAKGNFPRTVFRTIYDKKYIVNRHIEIGITKLTKEEDWIVFHSLRLVMELAGLMRKYIGKMILTKKAKNYLKNDDNSKLFYELLQVYTQKFNWAYNDLFKSEQTGQVGFLYLLQLLNKYGSKPRDLNFYTKLYFKAFPFLELADDSMVKSRYSSNDNAVSVRFFARFAEWFGFAEIEYDKSGPYFQRVTRIKKKRLLSEILRLHKM